MKLFKRKKKPSQIDFLTMELRNLHFMCKARIGNGDLDLDDWVHRTHETTGELLIILDRLNGRTQ